MNIKAEENAITFDKNCKDILAKLVSFEHHFKFLMQQRDNDKINPASDAHQLFDDELAELDRRIVAKEAEWTHPSINGNIIINAVSTGHVHPNTHGATVTKVQPRLDLDMPSTMTTIVTTPGAALLTTATLSSALVLIIGAPDVTSAPPRSNDNAIANPTGIKRTKPNNVTINNTQARSGLDATMDDPIVEAQ